MMPLPRTTTGMVSGDVGDDEERGRDGREGWKGRGEYKEEKQKRRVKVELNDVIWNEALVKGVLSLVSSALGSVLSGDHSTATSKLRLGGCKWEQCLDDGTVYLLASLLSSSR